MTDITYKIHHFGLLCADTRKSRQFYQDVMKLDVLAEFYQEGHYDLTFLSSGSSLLLELVGAPFSAGEEAFIAKRGHALHHIALETADVDAAFAELTDDGLEVAWEPDDFEFVRHCGVYDLNGNVVEILQERDPLPKVTRFGGVEYQIHHPCLLSESWQETLAFYAKHFGFMSPFQYIYEHGGAFVYLVDPFFDPGSHYAMIEIIGKPYEEAREFEFAKKYGAGMDHAGFLVQDVDLAYRNALERGTGEFLPPYSDYGTAMCWIQDADGNDLELMLPLPVAELQRAFNSRIPYRPGYEDGGLLSQPTGKRSPKNNEL